MFIETNIRTVFLHLFFQDSKEVHDRILMSLIAQTLDQKDPRSWYYALMDYGVVLKRHYVNPSRRSLHHVKQSKFEGSVRQLRGAIIRYLARHECASYQDLAALADEHGERLRSILERLISERLVHERDGFFSIASGSL